MTLHKGTIGPSHPAPWVQFSHLTAGEIKHKNNLALRICRSKKFFFVVLACPLPILDGFDDEHFQTTVHFPQTFTVD